ncbi:ATP-binding protein [Palleronia sp. LCG004]|uniref:ATP-binding protein n=1 Tax=Palleronia sp. LCG004 TaxID=3079304 RepID=UPI002941D221|nr:ATP-binding protein [Palleronia sp. LCG004]WOI57438.1 ATP-binding protein [Palleronia sp. LCG004]
MRRAFEMPATIDAVDPTVVSLKAVAAGYLSDDKLAAFEIALCEALVNVVEHAFDGAGTGAITVEFEAGSDTVALVVSDMGRPAPPDLFQNAPALEAIDTMAESGRGLSLIGHLADGVSYRSSDGTNRLTLEFVRGDGS